MEKRYLVIILVILAAYGVSFFNQRSVGRAVDDNTAIFEDVITQQGGDVVPFPTTEEAIQPEAKNELLQLPTMLFYGETTIFDFPEAHNFIAAVERIAARGGIEKLTSNNIAQLFNEAKPTNLFTTEGGKSFLRASKPKMR